MPFQRIWNLTDDPSRSKEPLSIMVLGKVLHPGGALEVDATRLKSAKKVLKDVEVGRLYLGMAPPLSYLTRKRRPGKTRLPAGVTRSHGEGKESVKPEAPKVEVAELPEDLPLAAYGSSHIPSFAGESKGKKKKG
jgi:hypothetical protein